MEEEHIASAQALLHMAQSGQCRGLPETGDKLSELPAPADAWLSAEHQRSRTEQLFNLIAEPLVVKRSELISAAWLPDEDRAELSTPPGKFWQYMGYENQRRKFLRWEEAMMLCEMGVVQLTVDGQSCSLQEVRARLLAGSAERERQYRLYAYLTRLGYRPVRHGDTWTPPWTTDYERKIRLDQYTSCQKSKRHRAGSDGTASPEPKLPRDDSVSCDVAAVDAAQTEPKLPRDDSVSCDVAARTEEGEKPDDAADASMEAREDADAEGQQFSAETSNRGAESHSLPTEMATSDSREHCFSSNPGQNGSGPALKRLDFTAEKRMFPRVPPGAGLVTLQSPPRELLPPGVEPRNQYCLNVAAARRGRRPEREGRDMPRDRYPSCLPVLRTPVRSWAEFKRQAETEAASAAGSWSEATASDSSSASLVPPGWRGSPADLLSRLRLAPAPAPAPAQALPPLYDVFPSDAPYRKSAPPLPEFRVFVVRPEDLLAELSDAAPSEDGVPLCAAVVADAGAPALYTVRTGRLPIDTSVLDQVL